MRPPQAPFARRATRRSLAPRSVYPDYAAHYTPQRRTMRSARLNCAGSAAQALRQALRTQEAAVRTVHARPHRWHAASGRRIFPDKTAATRERHDLTETCRSSARVSVRRITHPARMGVHPISSDDTRRTQPGTQGLRTRRTWSGACSVCRRAQRGSSVLVRRGRGDAAIAWARLAHALSTLWH